MKQIRAGIMALLVLTIITGLIYPLIVTLIGKTFFGTQANGSIIYVNNQAVASKLIGQEFTDGKYLWSRPSATGGYPYNALASSGSNLAPSNPQLLSQVTERVAKLKLTSSAPVPIDLVTTSGSGLDPEISVAGAYYQIRHIARARGVSDAEVKAVIDRYVKYGIFGFGAPRVNVVEVNLALDGMNQGRK